MEYKEYKRYMFWMHVSFILNMLYIIACGYLVIDGIVIWAKNDHFTFMQVAKYIWAKDVLSRNYAIFYIILSFILSIFKIARRVKHE